MHGSKCICLQGDHAYINTFDLTLYVARHAGSAVNTG